MEKLKPLIISPRLAEALEVSESGFAAHRRKAQRPGASRTRTAPAHPAELCAEPPDLWQPARAAAICAKRASAAARTASPGSCAKRGLRARQKRRFRPRTTDSRHAADGAETGWPSAHAGSSRPGLAERYHLHRDARGLALSSPSPSMPAPGAVSAHHCREDSLASSLATRPWIKPAATSRPLPGCSIIATAAASTPAPPSKRCLHAWRDRSA